MHKTRKTGIIKTEKGERPKQEIKADPKKNKKQNNKTNYMGKWIKPQKKQTLTEKTKERILKEGIAEVQDRKIIFGDPTALILTDDQIENMNNETAGIERQKVYEQIERTREEIKKAQKKIHAELIYTHSAITENPHFDQQTKDSAAAQLTLIREQIEIMEVRGADLLGKTEHIIAGYISE